MQREDERQMTQWAPYPDVLAELVVRVRYRPGWSVRLIDGERGQHDGREGGLTLSITTRGYDSYHPENGETYRVRHDFPVPPATYDERAWRRWLFEQFLTVERHEACEFFALGDEHPFAPVHAPGADPYTITEAASDVERRTSFRGVVKET